MPGFAKSLLFLLSLGLVAAQAAEVNFWPAYVGDSPADPQREGSWDAVGPLFFSQPVSAQNFDGAVRAEGFRPFFIKLSDPEGKTLQAYSLYPIFSYRRMTDGYRWSVFELINHYETHDIPGDPAQRAFDLWPFYFSRDTGSADSSYHAVFPIAGAVKNRFGQDRLSWFLFPLYGRFEKNRVTTTTAPWPFIKVLSGEGNHGFELWPLFGYRAKEASYREQFYLWPLIYKNEQQLWSGQTNLKEGFLPFYAMVRNAEVHSEMFTPFFGYVDRVAPIHYHETDYLWPIWIQGRGDGYMINRWGPFYTHSVIKGTDTKWVAWPFWKQKTWVDGALKHSKRQFFYFIYNETEQQSATNPSLPAARKAHYWPFVSFWDNGAGRRQIEVLSPLEVFFANNGPMRLSYNPFFALYRYNRIGPGEIEQSALWKFITYRNAPSERELHIGPLYSSEATATEQRYTIGQGLFSWRRSSEGDWHFSLFDFKSRQPKRPGASPAP
jgi:hypothetical protein